MKELLKITLLVSQKGAHAHFHSSFLQLFCALLPYLNFTSLPILHFLILPPLMTPLPSFLSLFTPQQAHSSSSHCRLRRLLFLTSFSPQLRLGGSTSALLPGDSHSKEQPWLSPLQLPSGKEGRACEGGAWRGGSAQYLLPAAILKVRAERPSPPPADWELSPASRSESIRVRD